MCELSGRSLLILALGFYQMLCQLHYAYTYTGVLDFAGPVQLYSRYTGWRYGEYWFFEIVRLGGAG